MDNSTPEAVDAATFYLEATINNIHKHFAATLLINNVQFILSVFGMVFNLALVYTVVHNKSAHTSLGFFLAIGSFGDFLSETTTIFPTFSVIFEWKIPVTSCFFIQMHGLCGVILGSWNILFISLDRLFAVCLPFQYDLLLRGTMKYVALLNCLPLGVISYLAYVLYDCALQHPELNVYCIQGDIGGDDRTSFLVSMVSGINVAPVIVYIVILAILRGTKSDTGNDKSQRERTRRLSKSLMVLISIIFSGFITFTVGGLLIPKLVSDFAAQMLLLRSLGQVYTVTTAINAPVLFFFSTEYRELMKKEFRIARWLSTKIARTNSTVITVPQANLVVSTQYGGLSSATAS